MTIRPRILFHWLLAFGFAVGQCGALVHESHHELALHPPTTYCALCAFAHAAPVAPAHPQLHVAPPHYIAAPGVVATTPAHGNFAVLPPSRAPPLFLA